LNKKNFVYLDVHSSLERQKENPWFSAAVVERAKRGVLTWASTEINFLIDAGLLRQDASARHTPLDQAVIRFSELTEEGQDFILSQATVKWLGACDKKSNDMLKKGASEEQRLAVYSDPKGLYKRLEKFRKELKERPN
jgi:hypothetical protein